MIRSIKRTRQIEDFVIEKLARRGLITEKQKGTEKYRIEQTEIVKNHKKLQKNLVVKNNLENPAEFVKGLCHVESMTNLCKRRIIQQENIFINQFGFRRVLF